VTVDIFLIFYCDKKYYKSDYSDKKSRRSDRTRSDKILHIQDFFIRSCHKIRQYRIDLFLLKISSDYE
jgi:hypothetical protein